MQLEYAYLSNFASFLQDGRLVVFGADIDGVESDGLPALAPSLVLVAKFWIAPEESLDGHTVSVNITVPSGRRQNLSTSEPLDTTRNRRDATRPSAAQVVINLPMIMEEAGAYLFHLIADGEEVKTIPLHVALIGSSEAAVPANANS